MGDIHMTPGAREPARRLSTNRVVGVKQDRG
jgi:hypothetical protein